MLIGGLVPPPASANHWAPPQTVFVPRTGHTADGLFLQVWHEQQALLGDPITEELRATTGLGTDPDAEQVVQYYENMALVYLPDAAPELQVQALPIGRSGLDEILGSRPAPTLERAARRTACGAGAGDTCLGFGATGHTIRAGILAFWEATGAARWLGMPLTEAYRAADGSWVQYFESGALRQRSGGDVEPLPLGLSVAKELRLPTKPIPQPDDVPEYDEALFIPPPEPVPVGWDVGTFGPGPQQGGFQEIVISISSQALWAYEGGEMVMSTYVSTGTAEVPETATPVGPHTIIVKVDVQDMEGTISGEYYFVEDVPYVMYIDDYGNALHGTYWHSNFGAPMSHGCINLPMDVAAWMYGWAPLGTPVTVLP